MNIQKIKKDIQLLREELADIIERYKGMIILESENDYMHYWEKYSSIREDLISFNPDIFKELMDIGKPKIQENSFYPNGFIENEDFRKLDTQLKNAQGYFELLEPENPTISVEETTILSNFSSNFSPFIKFVNQALPEEVEINIDDEYALQNYFYAALNLYFDDIRKEEYTSSYANSSTRIDFLLKSEEIGIELKRTRDSLSDKKLVNELIEDIERYRSHHNCNVLFIFVYDPERRIDNPAGIINDLSRDGQIKVIVNISH